MGPGRKARPDASGRSIDLQQVGGRQVAGKRPGATKTASPRSVALIAQGLRVSQTRAAREMRRRLISPIAVAASSRPGRAFTSTNATSRRAAR